MRLLLIFGLLLSASFRSLSAQQILQMDTVVESTALSFTDGSSAREFGSIAAKQIYSPEDYTLCLFHREDLLKTYSSISSLKQFYEERNGVELWKNTMQRLFWDRQSITTEWRLAKPVLKEKVPSGEKNKETLSPFDFVSMDLYNELNFCLQYLKIDHTDVQLTGEYLVFRKKLISELANIGLSERQKAWILANDIYDQIRGYSAGFLL